MDPDPDPGGSKTRGSGGSGTGFRSGSATLVKTFINYILSCYFLCLCIILPNTGKWIRIQIQEHGNLPKLTNKPDFQPIKTALVPS